MFAGDRREELRRRLAGATYAEIAAAGGGIVSTVTATRAATEEELVEQSRPRLDEMLACGTTTCEIKSGYGLDVESELRMLRAIARARHAARDRHRRRRSWARTRSRPSIATGADDYVDLVIDEMIPAVAAEKLAEWCDVFCETGVFTPGESLRILEAGIRHGLKPRIHADELGPSGGSQVAAQVGARSADHLIFVPDDGIQRAGGAPASSRRCCRTRRSTSSSDASRRRAS